jgi:O-antigen/teichoic acid export membrane protein
LAYVLAATAIAGAIGYIIQALVPGFVGASEYVAFSVFWSIVYLVVSALAGLQQEVTRATHMRAAGEPPGWRVIGAFGLCASAIALALLGASSPLWAPSLFGAQSAPLVIALLVGAVGYSFVALLSGALYGVRDWGGVAAMTVTDSAIRLCLICGALMIGAGTVVLGWAVALPFAIAVVSVWLFTGRRVRRDAAIDVGLRGLARNSISTVLASTATGLMISGLPFLLGITRQGIAPGLLASLILVITLTRAPLVIPLLALQSYLVVTFRDHPASARRRVVVWSAALVGASVVLAAAAIWVGPWVVNLLYGDRYALPSAAYAFIVLSAGLTGLLCITGPAVLAAGRHGWYLAGWATASVALVVLLSAPLARPEGILVALVAAPLFGVGVHAWGLRARSGASTSRLRPTKAADPEA